MRKTDGSGVRRFRLAVAAVVSAGLLVPLAAFGAGGSGQTSSAAQYKVTICHHTHSKKHPTVTIRVSNKAWPAHQRHGDTMGACATPKKAKHAKHAKAHQQGKSHDQGKSHGNNGNKPSQSQAQSPSHANEHASEHAKGHGK